jgi:hypothetical protein
VAVGCGTVILLYRVFNSSLELAQILDLTSTLHSTNVRYQRLSFSIDSKKLVAATQISQTPQKHAVYTNIWECSGSEIRKEESLDPVKLTVVSLIQRMNILYLTDIKGYADDSGVSSVFYLQEVGDRIPARLILTAGVSKPYPSILFCSKLHRNRHLELSDKRIDAAAQCQSPSISYNVLLRSGRHRIFLCDTRSGHIQLVADLSAERKNMKPKSEKIALGIISDNLMFAVWRKGDNDLRLSKLTIGGRVAALDTIDLAEIYRNAIGR